jgi:hypothetical protein
MANAERQSRQRRDRQIHSRRSPEVNFGRFPADLGRKSLPLRWIEVMRIRWFDPIA